MKMHSLKPFLFAFAAALFALCSLATDARSQRRDFVNDQEAELIREYQEIDRRIEVLMKFIDRRLAAAGIPGHNWTVPKNIELWGEEPKGARHELLYDVKRILQKAVDDIDDIASRETSAIEGNEKSGKLFPKAVRNLASGANRFKPIFQAELANTTNEKEKGVLYDSIELCDQIVEAAANLPKEPTKEEKKKTKN
jgi:hypothetical protein